MAGFESPPPFLTVDGLLCATEPAIEEIAQAYLRGGDKVADSEADRHIAIGDCRTFQNVSMYVVSRRKVITDSRGVQIIIGLAEKPWEPATVFAFVDERMLTPPRDSNFDNAEIKSRNPVTV